MSAATWRRGQAYVTAFFDGGEHVASQLGEAHDFGGSTFVSGQTQPHVTEFRENFCHWPTTPLATNYTFEYAGNPRTLHVVGWWQSNWDGRGFIADATIGVGDPRILPNEYPYDYNFGGLGDEGVGPGIIFAASLLAHPRFPYQRVSIYSCATGNTTIETVYGTDGFDGNFAVHAGDTDILAGPITSTGIPCLIRPGDDYVTFGSGGEANRAAGTALGMGAKVVTFHEFVRNAYLVGARCRAHVLQKMCETAPAPAQQAQHEIANAELEALEDHSGDPPTYLCRYTDSDMRPDETQHASTAGHERAVPIVANALCDDGVFDE